MCGLKRLKGFQLLKKNVIEQLLLALRDFNKPFQVRCDASGTPIGVVLSHGDGPIAFFSEKLNDAKQKYYLYDQEFHAIVQELKKSRHYLMCGEFVLYTDNHDHHYIM